MKSFDQESVKGEQESNLSQICNDFADMTTAHGIPNVINGKKIVWKLFWSTIIVIACVMFFIQGYQLFADFYSYHTNVNLVHSESAEFPAATICNFNMMRRSKMPQRLKQYIPKNDKWITDIYDYSWMWDSDLPWSDESENNFDNDSTDIREKRGIIDSSSEYDWSSDYWFYGSSSYDFDNPEGKFGKLADNTWDLVKYANVTKEELKEMGHQGKDFILKCDFNKKACDESNFTSIQNKEYGNCFSFNTKGTQANERRVTKVGSTYGLHLTLFIQNPEYIFTEESGVRLVIHPRDSYPHPEDIGISLSPGFATSIGIRQVELRRLKSPYGDCTNGEDHDYINKDKNYKYGIISCQKQCRLTYSMQNCSCVDDLYTDDKDVEWCATQTQKKCIQGVNRDYHTEKLECDCPAPCQETVYKTQLSTSLWPVDSYAEHLHEQLNKSAEKLSEIWDNIDITRKNLVRVKIYFEELNYELIEQVPSNSIPSLLGAVGGLLGLYLGFSVITLTEISVFGYKVIAYLYNITDFK